MTVGKDLVNGERLVEYGPPERAFAKIASVWSAVLEVEVTKEQVVMCMLGLKLIRESNSHKSDNLDDIDGYNEILKMFSGQDVYATPTTDPVPEGQAQSIPPATP